MGYQLTAVCSTTNPTHHIFGTPLASKACWVVKQMEHILAADFAVLGTMRLCTARDRCARSSLGCQRQWNLTGSTGNQVAGTVPLTFWGAWLMEFTRTAATVAEGSTQVLLVLHGPS